LDYDNKCDCPNPIVLCCPNFSVLQGCVKWADENGVKVITEKEMKIIADKRSAEKKSKKK